MIRCFDLLFKDKRIKLVISSLSTQRDEGELREKEKTKKKQETQMLPHARPPPPPHHNSFLLPLPPTPLPLSLLQPTPSLKHVVPKGGREERVKG